MVDHLLSVFIFDTLTYFAQFFTVSLTVDFLPFLYYIIDTHINMYWYWCILDTYISLYIKPYLLNKIRLMMRKLMMITASTTMIINIARKVSNPHVNSALWSDTEKIFSWILSRLVGESFHFLFSTYPSCLHHNISLAVRVHCLHPS